ncbi:hypothetical protein SAMN05428975_4848 [Mucilaginibacter sp. OK268]|uniref:hypothetical protein n=1 Tax=Mucilaginibacter sp. OK268 TaxID=1881048 RepID=UPI00088BD657|nr:hypothetical protein [Mucilaginibacter sp. OK268]SDP98937.1 hypothetical protein SAMN05428975_4848 [Mucilaginibacter sp. OK268]
MSYISYCKIVVSIAVLCLLGFACTSPSQQQVSTDKALAKQGKPKNIAYTDTSFKVIHVFVALCDNKYQGIVPVPPKIGNGQDPDNNLYWGCDNGVRTYFKKSKDWQLVKTQKVSRMILERLVFKHRTKKVYLVADAWDGQSIEKTTTDFLYSNSGQLKDTIHYNKQIIGIDGNAQLLAYIGHDGLMDFQLSNSFKNADGKTRDCIILACISKKYFTGFVDQAKANPLIWTTGLMCPEAYTLHDAITGYINQETNESIRNRGVLAYNKYQKCGIKAAQGLLVSGR